MLFEDDYTGVQRNVAELIAHELDPSYADDTDVLNNIVTFLSRMVAELHEQNVIDDNGLRAILDDMRSGHKEIKAVENR